jgi:hypothetical protein
MNKAGKSHASIAKEAIELYYQQQEQLNSPSSSSSSSSSMTLIQGLGLVAGAGMAALVTAGIYKKYGMQEEGAVGGSKAGMPVDSESGLPANSESGLMDCFEIFEMSAPSEQSADGKQ